MALAVPVNVSTEFPLEQIVVGLKLALAVGSITVKVTVSVSALVQLGIPAVVTLTKVTVVLTVYVPGTVAVPVAFSTMVWLAPPFIEYVTVALAVPVNVSVEFPLEQIVVGLKLALAVGSITVKVTASVSALVQIVLPAVVTLTKVTFVFTV